MDVFDLFAKISIDTSEYESGLNAASGKFKSFSDGISKLGGGIKDSLTLLTDGFKAVESVGKTALGGVEAGLKGFATASAAVGGFGIAAVKTGMSFDAAMSQVSAISGATGSSFDALREKAIEMGAKTQFSATEAAEAMTYMAMAGWKDQDMLDGISGIMNLAAASGEDLATVSDIVTDALTAFGMSAGESGRFADILAVASSNANTNVSMMGETFKYVAPVAGSLGYSAEDTALAIGLMANSGIKASQAGTSLRSIITRLSTDAGASSKSLGALGVLTERLGVQFYNTNGTARSLNDIIMDSRAAWRGLSEEQQVSYAKTIAGQEAMSAWLALMNAAPADVEKLTGALTECDGAAEKMAETMMDNLAGDIKLIKSAFESLQIAISDSLTPTLREFAQFGKSAIEKLLEGFQSGGVSGLMDALSSVVTEAVKMLADKAPEFVSVSGKFIAALAEGILNAREQIMTAANNILVMLSDGLGSWISSHSQDLIDFGNDLLQILFKGFLAAGDIISENIGRFIPLIVDAFATYHEALFTVGIDILGAIGKGIVENKSQIQSIASDAIASMVTALRKNAPMIIEGGLALLEAIANAIKENAPLIMETGAEIIQKLIKGFSGSTSELLSAVIKIVSLIVEYLVSNAEGLIAAGMQLLEMLVQGVLDNLPAILDAAVEIMAMLAEGIEKASPTLAKGAVEIIVALSEGIEKALPDLAEGAVQIIVALAEGIGKALPELIPAAVEAVMKFLEGLTNPESMSNLLNAATALINGLIEGIANAIPILIEYAPEIIANLVMGLIAAIPKLIEVGINLIEGIISGLIQGLMAIPDAIAQVVTAIVDGFKTLFGIHSPSTVFADMGINLIEGLLQGISDTWETIVEFFQGALEALIEFFGQAWETIREAAATAWEAIKEVFAAAWDGIVEIWSVVVDFFAEVWEGIKGVFSVVAEVLGEFFQAAADAVQAAWEAVVEFFSGVWEGIKTIFSVVEEVLGGFFEAAAEAVQAAWNAVVDFFVAVAEAIYDAFKEVTEFLGEAFKKAWEIVKTAWEAAKKFFEDLWESIKKAVEEVRDAIGEAFKKAWELVKEAWSNVKEFFQGILEDIIGVFSNVKEKFLEIGGNIVNGLKEGVSKAWGAFTKLISDKVGNLVKSIKKKLGIASPSKVFAGIGGNMALGLSEGWEDEYNSVKKKIESGLNFGATLSMSDMHNIGTAQNSGQDGFSSKGGNTFNFTFNSPKAMNAVEAANAAKKVSQQVATCYL